MCYYIDLMLGEVVWMVGFLGSVWLGLKCKVKKLVVVLGGVIDICVYCMLGDFVVFYLLVWIVLVMIY